MKDRARDSPRSGCEPTCLRRLLCCCTAPQTEPLLVFEFIFATLGGGAANEGDRLSFSSTVTDAPLHTTTEFMRTPPRIVPKVRRVYSAFGFALRCLRDSSKLLCVDVGLLIFGSHRRGRGRTGDRSCLRRLPAFSRRARGNGLKASSFLRPFVCQSRRGGSISSNFSIFAGLCCTPHLPRTQRIHTTPKTHTKRKPLADVFTLSDPLSYCACPEQHLNDISVPTRRSERDSQNCSTSSDPPM